jgi:hypothetical protein
VLRSRVRSAACAGRLKSRRSGTDQAMAYSSRWPAPNGTYFVDSLRAARFRNEICAAGGHFAKHCQNVRILAWHLFKVR